MSFIKYVINAIVAESKTYTEGFVIVYDSEFFSVVKYLSCYKINLNYEFLFYSKINERCLL